MSTIRAAGLPRGVPHRYSHTQRPRSAIVALSAVLYNSYLEDWYHRFMYAQSRTDSKVVPPSAMHLQTALTLPFLSSAIVPDYTTSPAGNPFISGWYADPDAKFFPSTSRYWVYPTSSFPGPQQTYLDAFSSSDLVHWTKHRDILNTSSVSWAKQQVWAPCVVERNGTYYLYFAANDIWPEDGQIGGIGVAVSDTPDGPFKDAIGKPLIGDYHHGAQPIDQDVFLDDDGSAYIYYGGHSHAVMAKLTDDMTSLDLIDYGNGTTEVFREITPPGYVEGPVVFKRKGVYYMMWSEGGWGGPDYAVAYGTASSPLGPFERKAKILEQDPAVATGSGHNGVVNVPGTDIWYIVYHRRPLGETDENHRVVCYDRLYFEEDGSIRKVKMGVRDNFEDGKLIAWKTWRDEFEVVDGEMRNIIDEGGLGQTWGLALLDTNFTDQVYEADVRILDHGRSDGFVDSRAGLVFRVAEAGPEGRPIVNGYYAAINAYARKVMIGKCQDGSADVHMGETEMDIAVGTSYHLKVIAVGNTLDLYVDDMMEPKIHVMDLVSGENSTIYQSGRNGVFAYFVQAGFDNVVVEKTGTTGLSDRSF